MFVTCFFTSSLTLSPLTPRHPKEYIEIALSVGLKVQLEMFLIAQRGEPLHQVRSETCQRQVAIKQTNFSLVLMVVDALPRIFCRRSTTKVAKQEGSLEQRACKISKLVFSIFFLKRFRIIMLHIIHRDNHHDNFLDYEKNI